MGSKICLQCGNEITSKTATKFCCKSCSNTYTNLHRASLRGKMKLLTCTKCGNQYNGPVNTAIKFAVCPDCKHNGHPRPRIQCTEVPKQRKHLIFIKHCIFCGKEFRTKYTNAKYCSISCAAIEHGAKVHTEKLQYYYEHQNEFVGIQDNRVRIFKKDFIAEQDNKCAICGMPQEWNGNPLTFILDHIDGDATNNRRENLRCICPNCDSQLDTFKSRNKHSTRRDYYREKTIRLSKQ